MVVLVAAIPYIFFCVSVIANGTSRGGGNCKCGIKKYSPNRIVGGHKTLPHEFPWQVGITYFDKFRCAGSLISHQWILTAAHCLTDLERVTRVFLGVHNRKNFKGFSRLMKISQQIPHPRYHSRTNNNDIGVIKLRYRVTFRDEISPVCLPFNLPDLSTGDAVTVTGWGTTSEGGSAASDYLMKANVKYIKTSNCRSSKYKYGRAIKNKMFCAAVKGGGKDACQGDSGGPLVYENSDSVNFLVGIVSWGEGCARPRAPGVYVKVAKYLGWIAKVTRMGKKLCKIL